MTDRDWCNAQPDAAELNEAFDLAKASGVITRSTIAALIHKLQEARAANVVVPDGAHLIERERARQKSEEGWTADHDDLHDQGELAAAASRYALYHTAYYEQSEIGTYWPWHPKWWKPADAVRNLVKAGALIAAEIDRIQRKDVALSKKQEAST